MHIHETKYNYEFLIFNFYNNNLLSIRYLKAKYYYYGKLMFCKKIFYIYKKIINIYTNKYLIYLLSKKYV